MLKLILLLSVSLAAPSYEIGLVAGKIGKLNIIAINVKKGMFKIQTGRNEKDWKVISGSMNFTTDYNDKWTFDIDVQKRSGPDKGRTIMHYKGSICKYFNENGPRARENLYKAYGVNSKCNIKKGFYSFKNFYISESDLTVKAVPYGSFLLIIKVKNAANQEVALIDLHIDSLQSK